MKLAEIIVQSTVHLPPFPGVVQRALQLIDDPRSSVQDIVDAVQYDQSITASVLKVCNSAYFGLRHPVHSLKEALVLIGCDRLLEIILKEATFSVLGGACRGYDLERCQLWRHSVSCALLSQIISDRLKRPGDPTLFTAALIHDLGKVLMSTHVHNEFERIWALIQDGDLSFLEAEREVLGIDHAELGAIVAEKWQLPPEIIAAIRHHHDPFSAQGYQETVYLVYLSNLITLLTGIGGGADGLTYRFYKPIMQQYRLTEKDVEWFMAQLGDQFHQIEERIGLTD